MCVFSPVQPFSDLCDRMDYSLPSSSVHGTFQTRILGQVAISYSRGSSWPQDKIYISCVSCISRQILYCWATWEAPIEVIQTAISVKGDLSIVLKKKMNLFSQLMNFKNRIYPYLLCHFGLSRIRNGHIIWYKNICEYKEDRFHGKSKRY